MATPRTYTYTDQEGRTFTYHVLPRNAWVDVTEPAPPPHRSGSGVYGDPYITRLLRARLVCHEDLLGGAAALLREECPGIALYGVEVA